MDGPPAGPAWGGAILAKLRAEMSCGVCGELMADPHVVPICGHAFCRDCIHGVLEGPGITQSRCPTCRQPVWKRELLRNHKYASMIELLATDLGLRWCAKGGAAEHHGGTGGAQPGAQPKAS